MWQFLRKSPRALLFSLLVHGGLLVLLIVGFDWNLEPQPDSSQPKVVQAVVLDERKVQEEIKRLRQSERRKQTLSEQELENLRKEAKKARATTKQQRAEAERIRRLEEQRLAELKKRQQELVKRHKQAAQAKAQETKTLRDLKKKQEALQQKLREEQKRLDELAAKRKLEEQKLQAAAAKREAQEQERKQVEAKADTEAKRKVAAEAKRKAEVEAKLAAQAEVRRQAEQQQRTQSVIGEYKRYIEEKVARSWLRPPGSPRGLSCTVKVNLIPGGDVISVAIVKSSGDPAFDRSVATAVYKAAPLPLPPDIVMFRHFREIDFIFRPES
ncbi:MAG: cell envelope integrity protein TolA [Gammaproteobacteria bacterium]